MRFCRVGALLSLAVFARFAPGQSWTGYGHDAQHTGESAVAAQALNRIKWSASIDTVLQGTSGPLYIHYGTPVITTANTVLVPQRTNSGNAYQINAICGSVNSNCSSAGTLLYTLSTAYTPPPHDWIPSFGGTLGLGSRYFYPGPGGTVLYRDTPDSVTGNSGQLAFYGLANYQANESLYNGSVMISTPITADRFGNVYFGFLVTGTVTLPGGTNLTSGLARIWLRARVRGSAPIPWEEAQPALSRLARFR